MKRIGMLTLGFIFIIATTGFCQCDYDFQNQVCIGDSDYDCDVDGTDAAVFKSHFGRHEYDNPCPPDGPAPVSKTGQTLCYNDQGIQRDCTGTGEDGEHQKGVAYPNPRFTDNGNGTITDKLTGLLWLKNADCFGARTWNQALSDCNGLASGQCGITDGSEAGSWRLANIDELLSLVDRSQIAPSLTSGHPFIAVRSENYWSSTTSLFNTNHAWFVWFGDGFSDFDPKAGSGYVWPVRGGR
jgi:hypothetical protein